MQAEAVGALLTPRGCGCFVAMALVLMGSCQVWSTRVLRESNDRHEAAQRARRVREANLRSRFDACGPEGRRELAEAAAVACAPSAGEMGPYMRCVEERLEACGSYDGRPALPSANELFTCERHARSPDRRCAHQRRALERRWRAEFDASVASWAEGEWDWERYRFLNRHRLESR